MCFGLSEPNAGSDASMIKTKATRDGNGWRIDGRKIWTTNAPIADYCVIFAVTNPDLSVATKSGITAFLVPTDTPGFTVQRIIKLFGHIGGDEAELAFDNLYVEPWQVVGEIDNGFAAALYGVSLGHLQQRSRCRLRRWSLELALDYAKQEKRSDRRLLIIKESLFLWQSLLPSSTQRILWASMLPSCSIGAKPAVKELSMAKTYSVKVATPPSTRPCRLTARWDLPMKLGLSRPGTLRIVNVADGTNEILNRTIAQRLLKGDVGL